MVIFSIGKVTGGSFENIGLAGGGDAIDVSGSYYYSRGHKFLLY